MALPSGYKRVAYIEGTGTQWAMINVLAKSTLTCRLRFNMTEPTGYSIFGYYTSQSDAFRLFNFSGTCYLDFGDSTSGSGRIFGGSMPAGVWHKVEFGNLYVKNLDTGANIISGTPVQAFQKSTKLYVFGNQQYSKGKIDWIRVYDGGRLVCDLVSCVRTSDNVAGLYDRTTNSFYPSAGSSAFIAGPAYTPQGSKTTITGTDYEVTGGRVMLNGAVHEIASGQVMLNGAGYTIQFKKAVEYVTVELTNEGNSNYGYVIIDGTKHYSKETLRIPSGTPITLYASTTITGSSGRFGGRIYVNGSLLAESRPASVRLIPYSDVSISFIFEGTYYVTGVVHAYVTDYEIG